LPAQAENIRLMRWSMKWITSTRVACVYELELPKTSHDAPYVMPI